MEKQDGSKKISEVVEIPGRCPLHFGQYLASRIAVYRKMTQDGIGDEKSAISISC